LYEKLEIFLRSQLVHGECPAILHVAFLPKMKI
jgi:hypothetical protein